MTRSLRILPIVITAIAVAQTDTASVLSLEQCISSAVRKSPPIIQARARYDEMNANAGVTATGFIPDITLAGRYEVPISTRGGETSATNLSANIVLSQSVIAYIGTFHRHAMAQLQSEIARVQMEGAYRDTVLSVQRAYFAAMAAREYSTVYSNRMRRLEETIFTKKLERQYDLESSAAMTMMNADMERIRHSQFLQETAYTNSIRQLLIAMGEKEYRSCDVSLQEDGNVEYRSDAVIAGAVSNSWKLKTALLDLRQEEVRLAESDLAYWPTVTLNAGYYYYRTISDLTEARLGVSFSYPITAWLETMLRSEGISHRVSAARNKVEDLRVAIRQDAREAYESYASLIREESLLKTEYTASIQYLAILRQYYRQGRITYSSLEPQEDKLFRIESDIAANRHKLRNIRAILADHIRTVRL